MTKIDYNRVFQMFCSEERENLKNPFKQNGIYCGTDGHSLIWIPIKDLEKTLDSCNEQDKPNVHAVLPKEKDFYKTPIIIEVKKLIEAVKKNKLPEFGRCSSCEGNGYAECDLGHEHECYDCNGSGECESSAYYSFGKEGKLRAKILHRLIRLCGLIEVSTIEKIKGTPDKSWYFKVGIFHVILMPYLYDELEDELKLESCNLEF